MHTAPGCFGSMISYDHKEPMCQACPAHVECQARVNEIRPRVLALLDRFTDGTTGREMSYAWLTKTERKKAKQAQLDDGLVTMALEVGDVRNTATLARAARTKVDPRTCSADELGGLSKHMRTIVSLIGEAPSTRKEIADALQERSNLTYSSAARTATREVSLLISAGRARFRGPHLELA